VCYLNIFLTYYATEKKIIIIVTSFVIVHSMLYIYTGAIIFLSLLTDKHNKQGKKHVRVHVSTFFNRST
jgi:hypothetical protein